MESLYLAASVVIPMGIYMLIGGGIRKVGWFSSDSFRKLNVLSFKVLIPLSLFSSIYDADLGNEIHPGIFAFAVIGVLVICIGSWAILGKFKLNSGDKATMVQGIYRSNFVLFGGAIGASLCDSEGIALVAGLSAVVVPLFNLLAVIIFELSREGKIAFSKTIGDIFRNPLIEAGIWGLVLNLLNISLPTLLLEPLEKLAASATPIALVALGGILSFGNIKRHKKMLILSCLGRLIFAPVLMIGIGGIVGYRNNELIAILSIFASPTAVASTPMAQSMGGNGELAGEIVAITSTLSIITIFLYILFCSEVGWLL